MRHIALVTTVDHVAGVATVTIRGAFGSLPLPLMLDRLAWVAEWSPRRLVLDLGTADCTEQIITLIATARRQLSTRLPGRNPSCQPGRARHPER